MTTMTEREAEELSLFIRKLNERMLKNNDKALAKRLLVGAGIITPKGNLRRPYRHLPQALAAAKQAESGKIQGAENYK